MTARWRAVIRTVAVMGLGATVVLGAPYITTVQLRTASLPAPTDTGPKQVPVRSVSLVCPGPQTTGLADVLVVEGTTTVAAASAPTALVPASPSDTGQVAASSVPGGSTVLTAKARGVVVTGAALAATSVVVTALDAMAPGASATQTWLSEAGDSRALVTTPCLAPAAEHWLVAGGAQATRRERLILTNPAANPVTVTVTVHGTTGLLPSLGTNTLTVAAQSRSVVLIDGIAPQETSPVVHVVASGGLVAAVLNDAWIEAATGRGGDDAVSLTVPQTSLVIPVGLAKATTLRVAVPGVTDSTVQVRLLTPDGPKSPPANSVVSVAGGATRDIDLAAVTDAVFAVEVRATHPVVAAALVQRFAQAAPGTAVAQTPSDLAWVAAVPPVGALAGAALAPERNTDTLGQLILSAPGADSKATVTTVTGGTVTSRVVTVAAATVTTIDVATASQVWVSSSSGTVYAAVVLSRKDADPPLLSVLPLPGLTLLTSAVVVRDVGS